MKIISKPPSKLYDGFWERFEKKPQNFLKDVDSEWDVTHGENEVTCHSRMVGGVLCRWWGDGSDPSGVRFINEAIERKLGQ